jgi:uncharacterized membrane protein YfcA
MQPNTDSSVRRRILVCTIRSAGSVRSEERFMRSRTIRRGILALLVGLVLGGAIWTGGAVLASSPAPVAGGEALITDSMPDKLKEAIAANLASEEEGIPEATRKAIQPGEPEGFLGIPGAPSPSFVVGILWAIWVGWIFSTVGAFGGIMAGVGHLTVFGLADYAKSFGKGSPVNKLMTDSIRVSNQWLVGLAALVSSTNYYRLGRIVLPLGAMLAVGGMSGSYLVPIITAGKISLKAYLGVFGLIVFVIGAKLFYDTTPRAQRKKSAAKDAAAAFEQKKKESGGGEDKVKIIEGSYTMIFAAMGLVLVGVLCGNVFKGQSWALYASIAGIIAGVAIMPKGLIRFSWYGVEFKFKAWIPAVGGFFIATIASFLGIGGGFLFVPFLTEVAGLPMFIVAGTSALAVLVGMTISIFTFMVAKGVCVHWSMIGAELIGIFIGAMIGPRTSKYIKEVWLKRLFVICAVYVGLRYFSKGFFGTSWVPPF